ncbi:unnamed protein product [Choristocarpus tenellus]
MFEGFISSLLTRLLGEYVEEGSFSRETLRVGVWSGLVVLENMQIKKDLLDKLGLPLTLSRGIIGRLELHIPWSNLWKDPIVVVINRVFLVVEPKYEWDERAMKRREQAIKRSKIASAEIFRLSPHLGIAQEEGSSRPGGSTSAGGAGGGGKWSLGVQKRVMEFLITKIVDSVQVHVEEVHLRYEVR